MNSLRNHFCTISYITVIGSTIMSFCSFSDMESETFFLLDELLEELRELDSLISTIENQLYMQRLQRPYNIPYIALLEEDLKIMQINRQHLKD